MIEKTVLDYLQRKLQVPCFMEALEHPPAVYVLIEKTAGSRTNCINAATIAVQSIAETLLNAATLSETVVEAMLDIWKTENVFRCELNSSYNFTNTRTNQYRYQAVFDLSF